METPTTRMPSRPVKTEYYGPAIVSDVISRHALDAPPSPGGREAPPSFSIHLAETDIAHHSISKLINKMYDWRGYGSHHRVEAHPHCITLAASGQGRVLGTATLGTDCANGILADEVFKDEIDAYRNRGARVCEVTKLAIDPAAHPKLALASLFHILYIYARKIYACTDVFIEVNPRHRRFYEQMLGFQRAGEVKENPRVKAKAYLLRISLEYMGNQIARLGGTGGQDSGDRSLYPYFFGPWDEHGITSRLMPAN